MGSAKLTVAMAGTLLGLTTCAGGRDGAPMLLIPAGEFQMGSTEVAVNEKRVHRVSLEVFYLDTYEVTNKRFQKFLQETAYVTTAE